MIPVRALRDVDPLAAHCVRCGLGRIAKRWNQALFDWRLSISCVGHLGYAYSIPLANRVLT
jgi:hypothetical protein